MHATLLIAAMLASGSQPADTGATSPEKRPDLLVDYEFGVMGVELGMRLEEPATGEELLSWLRSAQRFSHKKRLSRDQALEAMLGFGYVQGAYRAFLLGVAAENGRENRRAETASWVPPLCQTGGSISYSAIVDRVIAIIEKLPANTLKASAAHATLVTAFLQGKLYAPCEP